MFYLSIYRLSRYKLPMPIPPDPNFEQRIRRSFHQQGLMHTLGAKLTRVAAGEVHIDLPYDASLTQQDGYIHAGVLTTLADTASGYAAHTLMEVGARVLTVEFKMNFLAPATGAKFSARARVLKPGRTLTICACDVFAIKEENEKLVATMLATMFAVAA